MNLRIDLTFLLVFFDSMFLLVFFDSMFCVTHNLDAMESMIQLFGVSTIFGYEKKRKRLMGFKSFV